LRKTLTVLMLVFILLVTATGIYYIFIYLPEKKLEEKIKPLLDAGLTSEEAVKFDGIYGDWAPYNRSVIKYVRYWIDYPSFSEAVLNASGSLEDAFFPLDEVVPYISELLTEKQAHQLIEKWYPTLFEECKPGGIKVVFGDLEQDGVNNYEEIFELGTDPLEYNTWLKFVFNTTRRPSDFYEGSTDTRDLAAVFNYIQLLDKDSNPIETIEFEPGDEQYLVNGWYGLELWEDIAWWDISVAFAGNNSIVLMDIPENAHFFRFVANSIGGGRKSEYQNFTIGFKDLMSNPNLMKIYFNNKLVDKVPIYERLQYHYANLRPEFDSDEDGKINKFDPNPRIPDPKPVKSDIDIGAWYVTGISKRNVNPPFDWSIGCPSHPLLGEYDIADPDVADWHIKHAVEHGINHFVVSYTAPFDQGWERNFEDGFMRSKFLNYTKFSLFHNSEVYLNPDPGDPSLENSSRIFSEYVSKNFFNHPSYYKIDNKPAVFVYHATNIYGDISKETFISYLQGFREVEKNNGYNIYLIGDFMDPDHSNVDFFFEHFDAVTSYGILKLADEEWTFDEDGNAFLEEPYDRMITGYIEEAKYYYQKAKEHGKGMWAPFSAGYDTSYQYEKGLILSYVKRTGVTPEKYKMGLEGIRPFAINGVIVGHINEIFENSIEPSYEFGFAFYDAIREVFTNAPLEHEDDRPYGK